MNTDISKMSWFAHLYNTGQLKYRIAETGYKFGCVVMPTGTGKSSVIFEDTVYNIKTPRKNKKQLYTIVSHILSLNEQTFIDFFSILKNCRGLLEGKKVALYMNSSASTKKYEESSFDIDADILPLEALTDFEKSEYDIAFVTSCNKSLHKFINLKLNSKNIDIITYIDECHTIMSGKNSFNHDIDLEKLAKKCYKLYGLSATPEHFVTCINSIARNNNLNKPKYLAEAQRIVNLSAADAIKQNLIISPFVKFIRTKNGKLTSTVILSCMEDAINSGNAPYTKMLVTCYSMEEASKHMKQCEPYYKCFKNTSEDDWEITEFCKEVDKYQGHCLIFHCQKLIQGIDIKGLTDCIIVNNTKGNEENNTRVIQITGRCLRTAEGERGVCMNERMKKFANVYVVTNGVPEYENQFSRNYVQYFGLDNILYNSHAIDASTGTSPIKFDSVISEGSQNKNPIAKIEESISELKINMKKYLEDSIIPVYKEIVKNGAVIDTQMLIDSCDFSNISDVNTMELIENADKVSVIKETFKEYGIEL